VNPSVCLFTDSREPSGLGEHMLTLAIDLQASYDLSFACPATSHGRPLLDRATQMGLPTLALAPDGQAGPELGRWLRRRRVQVFHGHAGIGWEGHGGIYAAREAGVPVVIRTEHLPYLITKPHERAGHRRLMQRVDRLICVSEHARVTFVKSGVPPEQLRVVRNGIHPRPARADRDGVRARLGLPSEAQLVLAVGRLTEQKGHRYLVEAAPRVIEQEPRAHLLVVGQGELADELRELVRVLGLEGSVHLVGQRPDVPELLAASDLFVLPSLFEGLPLVALEAMAAGRPVVGTRGCGTAEAVADGVTGRLVPPRDSAALATAILEALEQPGLAARWGVAGRMRLEREFRAERMARETASVYEEVRVRTHALTSSRSEATSDD
jgi:glycosyltransferase involved in cell wall biosynthesis